MIIDRSHKFISPLKSIKISFKKILSIPSLFNIMDGKPKQFDYNSIRDNHKLKVHILRSFIKFIYCCFYIQLITIYKYNVFLKNKIPFSTQLEKSTKKT
jgi:hypothetical protein